MVGIGAHRKKPRKRRSSYTKTWEVEGIRSHWPPIGNAYTPKLFYYVKWKLKHGEREDWPDSENWVPERSMACPTLIDEYWKAVRKERDEGRTPLIIKPPAEVLDYIAGTACPSLYYPEISTNSAANKPLPATKSARKPRQRQTARMNCDPSMRKDAKKVSGKTRDGSGRVVKHNASSSSRDNSKYNSDNMVRSLWVRPVLTGDSDNESSGSESSHKRNDVGEKNRIPDSPAPTDVKIQKDIPKVYLKSRSLISKGVKHPVRARSIVRTRPSVDMNAESMLLINSAVRNLKAQVEIRKAKAGTYKAKESLLSEHINKRNGHPNGVPRESPVKNEQPLEVTPKKSDSDKCISDSKMSATLFFKMMITPGSDCCKFNPTPRLGDNEDYTDVSSIRSVEEAWSETDMTPVVRPGNSAVQVPSSANAAECNSVELEEGEILDSSEEIVLGSSDGEVPDCPEKEYRPEISTENLMYMLNNMNYPGTRMVLQDFANECWERKYNALNTLKPLFVVTFLDSPRGEPPRDWSMTIFENQPGRRPKYVCECVPTGELWQVAPELVAQAEERLSKLAENFPSPTNSLL